MELLRLNKKNMKILIEIDEKVNELIKTAAKKDGRSRSNYLTRLISKAIADELFNIKKENKKL